MARTRSRKTRTTTKSGNEDSLKPTSTTSLEDEAKNFKQKKETKRLVPLTSRRYMAGMFGAALLINSRGTAPWSEIKRTAYDLADYMLDDES